MGRQHRDVLVLQVFRIDIRLLRHTLHCRNINLLITDRTLLVRTVKPLGGSSLLMKLGTALPMVATVSPLLALHLLCQGQLIAL